MVIEENRIDISPERAERESMKQYEEKINKILSELEAQKAECAARIEAIRADIDGAGQNMAEALRTGNETMYLQAKEARNKSEDILEVVSARMNFLTSSPLISEAEYNEMVAGIMAAMQKANDRDKREVVKLAEKIIAVTNKNCEMIEEGNHILHRLQYDVYRAADCKKDKYGNVTGFGYQNKEYRDRNSISGWANAAIRNSVQYKSVRNSVAAE